MRNVLPLVTATAVFATLLVVGAVGAWRIGPSDSGEADLKAAIAEPETPCSTTQDWSSTKGERLRADKKAAYQARPEYAGPGSNSGDYAYPSQPVDIKGPGTYAFDFGPLDPDRFVNFPPPVSDVQPPGPPIALHFPPDYSASFRPTFDPKPSIVIKNGARYLRQMIVVSGDVRPCNQLILWLS